MERRVPTILEKHWAESGQGDGKGDVKKDDLQSYWRPYMVGKEVERKTNTRETLTSPAGRYTSLEILPIIRTRLLVTLVIYSTVRKVVTSQAGVYAVAR